MLVRPKENLQGRKEKEMVVVEKMISLYCKKHKHKAVRNELCEACETLKKYAFQRTQKCPFGEKKTFCNNCQVHCYKPEMREKIREVMRFSGPRSIIHFPKLVIGHMIESRRQKKGVAR